MKWLHKLKWVLLLVLLFLVALRLPIWRFKPVVRSGDVYLYEPKLDNAIFRKALARCMGDRMEDFMYFRSFVFLSANKAWDDDYAAKFTFLSIATLRADDPTFVLPEHIFTEPLVPVAIDDALGGQAEAEPKTAGPKTSDLDN